MSGPEFGIAVAFAVAVVALLMKTFGRKEPDQVERLLGEVAVHDLEVPAEV